MRDPMIFDEFLKLVEHVEKHHSVHTLKKSGKTVKYITPVFAVLGADIFSITFRGYGWEHNINCINENRDLPVSLFDRCIAFLDEA